MSLSYSDYLSFRFKDAFSGVKVRKIKEMLSIIKIILHKICFIVTSHVKILQHVPLFSVIKEEDDSYITNL